MRKETTFCDCCGALVDMDVEWTLSGTLVSKGKTVEISLEDLCIKCADVIGTVIETIMEAREIEDVGSE